MKIASWIVQVLLVFVASGSIKLFAVTMIFLALAAFVIYARGFKLRLSLEPFFNSFKVTTC